MSVGRRDFIRGFAAAAWLGGAVPTQSIRVEPRPKVSPEKDKAAQVREFFYRPNCAWAGDFIPFYKDGEFRLFYLHDWRDPHKHGEGTPWYQITTRDFVHFAERGEMLPRGSNGEQDLYVFTGSVIEAEGRYHIFYTGHNPYFRKQGKPEQGVMHAVSDDLLNWRKLPEETLYAPPDRYEPHDWRDPFVFWNEEAREYWMLLAARLNKGPSRRRGCTALCVSKNLKNWEVRDAFWAPGLYFTHECPDLFKLGDWWYLVYSEFSERMQTRYRMSRSLHGPWLAPENDTFDGRAFYAAKTASDGRHRFVFGWNPTRVDGRDDQPWQWGGNLVVHEIVQGPDGALWVKVPEGVDQAFATPVPVAFRPGLGECEVGRESVRIKAHDSFACAVAEPAPEPCKIEVTVELAANTRGCGIMLRASDDLEEAYYIRLEPGRGRLVFDSWPRAGDIPFVVGLERPVALTPGQAVTLKVFVDGSICEVYAADRVAMSARLYNRHAGNWGVFVNEGQARFVGARVRSI